jgi:Ala-tRNA(Pro) deacylase
MRIDEFLSNCDVAFERLPHRLTFTSNRLAQALHVKGHNVAKSVLVRTGRGFALAVLPATHQVNLPALKRDLGDEQVELAGEEDVAKVFQECEPGVRPPFGSLYHVPTIVDEELTKDEAIVFEAQNHEEALRVAYGDYERLEHPKVGHFAQRR